MHYNFIYTDMYRRCILVILAITSLVLCNEQNIGQIRINLKRQKTPLEQHLNAPNLKKYGLNFQNILFNSNSRTNDSIALRRYLDNEFYGQIVIGHPGQTVNVAFDTAWGLSWVISSKCEIWKRIGCWFHNRYDHTKSSEWKKDNRPYIGNEGKYNFTGFYSYDNISIAHSNVTAQSFVEMVEVPYTFIFNKIDGVLGLGQKIDDYEPFFYKLLRQKKIKDPIFSIYLNRDPQSTRGGNIMLGFYDDKHIHKKELKNKTIVPDQIKYLPVDAGQYWQFSMDSVVVNKYNKTSNLTLCSNGCKAIVDTSSNTIMGPTDDIEKIHDTIKAKSFYFGRYTVECDTVNKLPTIDFVLGGRYFRLEGPQYVIKMSVMSFTLCLSSFTSTQSDQEFWVLGGAFLAEYYSIYNVYDKTIGFVKAA